MKCLCVSGCRSCRYLGYRKHFLWQETHGAFGEVGVRIIRGSVFSCKRIILSGGGVVVAWQGGEQLPGEKHLAFLVSSNFVVKSLL